MILALLLRRLRLRIGLFLTLLLAWIRRVRRLRN